SSSGFDAPRRKENAVRARSSTYRAMPGIYGNIRSVSQGRGWKASRDARLALPPDHPVELVEEVCPQLPLALGALDDPDVVAGHVALSDEHARRDLDPAPRLPGGADDDRVLAVDPGRLGAALSAHGLRADQLAARLHQPPRRV